MTNPFDDENGSFVVVVNQEGHHSLWPVRLQVPMGWEVVFAADSRAACLDYVEKHWTGLRPAS